MRTFGHRPELCFGPDALGRLEALTCTDAVVVADPFFVDNGLAQALGGRLPGAKVTVFQDFTPDPSLEQVAAGVAVLQQARPQVVIALGGGSAIDCAKAMVFFYDRPVTFCAIPTTSGTGSEATSFSILTHRQAKHPLIDQKLLPNIAILDDSLLDSLPAGLIADGGFDLISHCLEALASRQATAVSDALALEALSLAVENLPASFRGDRTVRGAVHLAAAMAGLAFDHSGLGLCHALSHGLGGRFHKPHGRLNAVLLPLVVEWNAPFAAPAYRRAAERLGVACATDLLSVRGLCRALIRLRQTLKLPATLTELGIDPEELVRALPELTEAALKDPCLGGNPRPVTAREAEALLRRSL